MLCRPSLKCIVHDGKGVGGFISSIPGGTHKKLFQVHHFFLIVIDFYKVFPVVADILISAKKTGKRSERAHFLRNNNRVAV